MDNTVSIRLRLLGGATTAAEAKAVGTEIKGIGASSAEASAISTRAGGRIASTVGRLRGAWTGIKRLGKVVGAGLLAAGAAVVVWGKKAVSSTADLAKTTLILHQNLGLSVGTASSMIGLIKAWGGDTTKAGMAFKTFATQLSSAGGGSKTAVTNFRKLGFSGKDLTRAMHDSQFALFHVADGLHNMKAGADRTSIATKLFGRSWKAILPIIGQGSKGLREQLKWAREFGVTLNGHTVKSLHQLKEAEVKADLANQGLQIAFTEKLAPILIKVVAWFTKLINQFRKGKGPIQNVVDAVKPFAVVLVSVAKWLLKNKWALGVLVSALVAAKVAQLAMNATALANPYVAVAAAVAFAAVMIITHWRQVKKFFANVWKWIKDHSYAVLLLPLVGQVAFVVVQVIKHWGQLKQAAIDTYQWIKNAFGNVVSFFKALPGRIGAGLKAVGKAIAAPFIWAWGKIKWVVGKIRGALNWISDHAPHVGISSTNIGPITVPTPSISIPGFATGIANFAGGAAIVGERGPELALLPRGTDVLPHRQTAELIGSGRRAGRRGGREIRQPIQLMLDGRVLAETTVKLQEDAEARL